MLNYPLNLSQRTIKGPTLIYIDDSDNLNEVQLTREQVQQFIGDWNDDATDDDYRLRSPQPS